MNRIYIYVMLFSGILFLNSMTCFAANEKLSASSRQTLDQLIRSDNRLEKLSRQDKDAFRGSSALFTKSESKKRDNSDGEIHIV